MNILEWVSVDDNSSVGIFCCDFLGEADFCAGFGKSTDCVSGLLGDGGFVEYFDMNVDKGFEQGIVHVNRDTWGDGTSLLDVLACDIGGNAWSFDTFFSSVNVDIDDVEGRCERGTDGDLSLDGFVFVPFAINR